jgi:lipopolysaccharide transport system permease protein
MTADLREVWKYRELLVLLIQRDLKVRYKNSLLGFGWSFVNPLLQVLTITLVLQFLVGMRTNSYHAYVLCGMLPWMFFSTALMDACASLLSCYNLIRRTYFPREIIQLATIAANGIHLLMAILVFLLYMTLNPLFWTLAGHTPSWPIQATFLLTPIPLVGVVLLTTGLAFFLSVWTLYFEDVRFITDSALKIAYWLVPVVYFADLIPFRVPGQQGQLLYTLYMLNPLACFIAVFRKLTLPPTNIRMGEAEMRTAGMLPQDWGFLALAMATSSLVFVLGLRFYAARKWKLAERP